MNQNTKEQKALDACKELIKVRPQYFEGDSSERKALNLAVLLALEATAPVVSKAAQRAATRYFEGPVHDTTGEAVQCLARIIDEETKHVELRAALQDVWENFGIADRMLHARVHTILEATKCTP